MILRLWDVLGKKSSLLFGRECLSAAIWMLFTLVLRSTLWLFGLLPYIPYGVIFALPMFIQLLDRHLPFMIDSFPLLPVRLAESILGK